MKICDLLTEEKIIPSLKAKDKEGIINELVDLYRDSDEVFNISKVRDAVLDREKIMSTGVGKGFAIPHAKTNAVKELILAFGKSDEPIDYEALDGQPINLAFLIVARENMVGEHIRLLSRISRMMQKDDFRKALLSANDSAEIRKIICEEEAKITSD